MQLNRFTFELWLGVASLAASALTVAAIALGHDAPRPSPFDSAIHRHLHGTGSFNGGAAGASFTEDRHGQETGRRLAGANAIDPDAGETPRRLVPVPAPSGPPPAAMIAPPWAKFVGLLILAGYLVALFVGTLRPP